MIINAFLIPSLLMNVGINRKVSTKGIVAIMSSFLMLVLGTIIYRYSHFFPAWAINHIPDFMWTLAFCLIMRLIWSNDIITYALLVFATATTLEISQHNKLIKGTFDPLDILTYIIGIGLFFVIDKTQRK